MSVTRAADRVFFFFLNYYFFLVCPHRSDGALKLLEPDGRRGVTSPAELLPQLLIPQLMLMSRRYDGVLAAVPTCAHISDHSPRVLRQRSGFSTAARGQLRAASPLPLINVAGPALHSHVDSHASSIWPSDGVFRDPVDGQPAVCEPPLCPEHDALQYDAKI